MEQDTVSGGRISVPLQNPVFLSPKKAFLLQSLRAFLTPVTIVASLYAFWPAVENLSTKTVYHYVQSFHINLIPAIIVVLLLALAVFLDYIKIRYDKAVFIAKTILSTFMLPALVILGLYISHLAIGFNAIGVPQWVQKNNDLQVTDITTYYGTETGAFILFADKNDQLVKVTLKYEDDDSVTLKSIEPYKTKIIPDDASSLSFKEK